MCNSTLKSIVVSVELIVAGFLLALFFAATYGSGAHG